MDKSIDFSKQKPVKCKNCGHDEGDHAAVGNKCPLGRRHRTVGFTSYHRDNVFEPKGIKK